MVAIRPFTQADWPAIWAILAPVFRAGETYGVAPEIGESEAHAMWVGKPLGTYVATDEAGRCLGTYFVKANQDGPGAHVANCGYAVAEDARGQGIARAMCRHSQAEAVALGFRAMQYNLVVATNAPAIRVWRAEGFAIVGTLPGAFAHPRDGFVDAHVMYKTLV